MPPLQIPSPIATKGRVSLIQNGLVQGRNMAGDDRHWAFIHRSSECLNRKNEGLNEIDHFVLERLEEGWNLSQLTNRRSTRELRPAVSRPHMKNLMRS
jgi:hypothetical protein